MKRLNVVEIDELLDIIKTEIDHSNHFSNTVEV